MFIDETDQRPRTSVWQLALSIGLGDRSEIVPIALRLLMGIGPGDRSETARLSRDAHGMLRAEWQE